MSYEARVAEVDRRNRHRAYSHEGESCEECGYSIRFTQVLDKRPDDWLGWAMWLEYECPLGHRSVAKEMFEFPPSPPGSVSRSCGQGMAWLVPLMAAAAI